MKKPYFSIVTTWVIRILLFIIATIGVCLLMLSTMGGTSESHKKGLEQAFSDSLNADISIGSLDEFNIMPQLKMRSSNILGKFRDTGNQFKADNLEIGFGLIDLMSGRKRIESFRIDNFRLDSESGYDFRFYRAGIEEGPKPKLAATGEYDKEEFHFIVPVVREAGSRPAYRFAEENEMTGGFGALEFSGSIVPHATNSEFLRSFDIKTGGEIIARGETHKNPDGYKLTISCLDTVKISPRARQNLQSIGKLRFIDLSGNCPK